jgi:hypothetical protein
VAGALLLVAAPLAAQSPSRVSGSVRLADTRDTLPVPGARVVLHRVGLATQGPLDSLLTDPSGRFRFAFPHDTAANHLLSARFAGIEYFSSPLPRGASPFDEAVDILVFDTSSTAPARARSRTIVVSAPDAAGTRTVVDWFTLANEGVRTRVSADSTAATWGAALPESALDVAVGDPRFSQFSPDAVLFRGDSVLLTAPLSPGARSLLLEYELPPGLRRFELAVGGIDSLDLFTEEPDAMVRSAGWAPADTQQFQGRTFFRHRLLDRSATRLDLRLPGTGIAPGPALAVLVSLLAAALTAATIWRWRRMPGAAPTGRATAPQSAAALADQVARLDAEYRARPGDEAAARAYRDERERLMARLRDALAAGRPPS